MALIERWKIAPVTAQLLAHLANGRLGWAVRAATNPAMLETRRAGLDILDQVLREGRAERIAHAEMLAKKAEDLPELLELWLGCWRDVLLLQSKRDNEITNIDRSDFLRAQAARFSIQQIRNVLKSVSATARYLSQNVNTRLALEVLLLKLPS